MMSVISVIAAAFLTSSYALTPSEMNQLQEFVGSTPTLNLQAMEQNHKLQSSLQTEPWAGYYWPEGFGSIVAPYRDSGFPSATIRLIGPDSGFKRTMRWLRHHRGDNIAANIYSLSNEEIDELSPAEKYDLLFSDHDYTLTHSILSAIEYKANQGRVKVWEGICNGWSLASLNVDRPLKMVYAKSASGRMIPFYPHDLMAIASLLYARSPVNDWDWFTNDGATRTRVQKGTPNAAMEPVWLKFIGRRCDINGVDGCSDINPALLHLAIANSIGYQNSGFVMDKHKNETIANVSVFGYEMKLYNPNNGNFGSLAEAKAEYENNQFHVGVVLTLKSRAELHPFGLKQEEKPYQSLETSDEEKYSYTLILDKNDNIVDGYWSKKGAIRERQKHNPNYPDFLWKLPKDAKAYSGYEGSLIQSDWDIKSGVPTTWKQSYHDSSLLQQPLGVTLYQLVKESRR